MQLPCLFLLLSLGCGSAIPADAVPALFTNGSASIDWDKAFAIGPDTAPLHFVAQYEDPRGSHRLEEWRQGSLRLRRLTDARIDLHADATSKPLPGLPSDYLWQIVEREKKILHRVSSKGMLRAGMFYSFYSMAHVLRRPAGNFELTRPQASTAKPAPHVSGYSCTWFQLVPADQPASRICWSAELAIPLRIDLQTKAGAWTPQFEVRTLDRKPIPPSTFQIDEKGLQVRNVDELQQED